MVASTSVSTEMVRNGKTQETLLTAETGPFE